MDVLKDSFKRSDNHRCRSNSHTVFITDDSQFPILEGADEDVVLLHRHVVVAVRGDDLGAQKQETVNRSDEVVLCVCEKS